MNKKLDPSHTRPFNKQHAQDGAPYCCANGDGATIIKWDARGIAPLLGYKSTGETDSPAIWHDDGRVSESVRSPLVMTPLGMIDGKPVFVGDELIGYKTGNKFVVKPGAFDLDGCRWPAPPRVYPETKMSGDDLVRIAMHSSVSTSGMMCATGRQLEAVANAVLRHAIDAGQVVAPDDLHILQIKAANGDEWIEKTNWVQESSSSFPFHTAGKHRADVMKLAIEQMRGDYTITSRDLGKAERLLESLGYRSAGNGDWAEPGMGRQVEARAARDMAIARVVEDFYCRHFPHKSPNSDEYLAAIIEQVKP